MTLEIAPQVGRDLEEILTYIAKESRVHGDRLLLQIQAEFKTIARSPHLYRLRPEVGSNARVAIVRRYLVLFRVTGSSVRIERVVHGSRELSPIFLEALRND